MRVKGKKLRQLLNDYVMSNAEFARDMGVDVSEVEKMLNDESVGAETTRKFFGYLGPIEAERLIDWKRCRTGATVRQALTVQPHDANDDDGGGEGDL